jgi:hypothetical protein
MMRAIVGVIATAMFVTSPLNVAYASEYDDCVSQCDWTFGNRYGQCVERYGGSVEGEYCLLGVGMEHDGCLQGCSSQYPITTAEKPQALRFRPSEIGFEMPSLLV